MDRFIITSSEGPLPPPASPLILNPRNPAYCKDAIPSPLVIKGVQYVRKKDVATVGEPRKESSKVWLFGEALLRRQDKRRFYYCYDCEDKGLNQPLLVIDGTSSARHHMSSVHHRNPATGVVDAAAQKVDNQAVYCVVNKTDMKDFKEKLVMWLVVCQLAFFMLENSVFRDLLNCLNVALAAYLPKASATIRKWTISEYEQKKKALIKELAASISSINISFDIWTAGNWIGVISVWAYWIDAAGERQRRILAFRRIYRSHSGDNQAATLLEVLEEYEITHNVGYFVCDNASSNDAAVSAVLKALKPAISAVDITARRLRCIGHIINLSARSLLDPSGSELAIATEELDFEETAVERAATTWQSTGSLGKLHRLIKYILASPQRREEFGGIYGGRKAKEYDHLGLLIDNATRWNSVYRMLNRAINVKSRLTTFVRDHKPDPKSKYRPQDDKLLPKDWTFIQRLHDTLESFYASTIMSQGSRVWLDEWFTTLHNLLNEVDSWKVEAEEVLGDDYLAACLTASWNKIEKYYKLVDQTPVYYAAIVLHPSLKMQKLRDMWQQEEQLPWIPLVEEMVKKIWRTQYKPAQRPQSTVARRIDEDNNAFVRLANAKRLRIDAPTAAPVDALDEYLSSDPEPLKPHETVVDWWQRRQQMYPGLVKMAYDVFAIPLMSDDNERSFSSGRDMITYRRTRLRDDIIEACQCLKSWYATPQAVFDDEDTIVEDMDKPEANNEANNDDVGE